MYFVRYRVGRQRSGIGQTKQGKMLKRKKTFTFTERVDYIKLYIKILQAIDPGELMTSRELDVLATFLSFDGYVAQTARFSRSFRKEAMRQLNMSPAQLTNILKELTRKEVIREDQAGELYVDMSYIPGSMEGMEISYILHGVK